MNFRHPGCWSFFRNLPTQLTVEERIPVALINPHSPGFALMHSASNIEILQGSSRPRNCSWTNRRTYHDEEFATCWSIGDDAQKKKRNPLPKNSRAVGPRWNLNRGNPAPIRQGFGNHYQEHRGFCGALFAFEGLIVLKRLISEQ